MGIYTNAVQKLYVAYFSRPADAAGLAYWEGVVTAAKGNTAAVSAAFAASQEYKDTFAGQSAYQVINTIYQNLFGRPAEADALTFWGQGLLNGKFTIDNAVTAIAAGAQGTDLVAYNSKVEAATAFTAALDTSAEMIGYTGTAANNAAKAWLAGITTDAQLKAAIEPAALNVSVSAVTNPPIVGQTYNLTQGLDSFAGTSANDTFNAFAFNSASGADTTTLNSVDVIEGGAGNDVLNIEVKGAAAYNANLVGTVTNVETINIDNTGNTGAAPAVDASKFVGATTIKQITKAGTVSNLAAGTTAAFQGVTAAINVAAASAAATAAVSLTAVDEAAAVNVSGAKLSGVTVSGTRVDGVDAGATVSSLALNVTAGVDVQTVTVNSAVATTLSIVEDGTSTKKVTTVDASASAGAIAFDGDADVTAISTGAGKDEVLLAAATVKAATGVTAVNATVSTGAGDDAIEVDTGAAALATKTGATTVEAGAGDDTVTITTRSEGKLTVNLGDGADELVVAATQSINAGDVIDAGAGSDTLALNLVGAANIGAFSNFDIFDAAALARTLDVEILSSKNTVTEFIASGNVGVGATTTATLANIGAGVGVRITGDMAGSTLVANQKTAGALTVTVDADETGDADDDFETVAGIITTNATSVKAVFDTAYLADTTVEKAEAATTDNYTTLTLNAADATSVEVVSGGTNAGNQLNLSAAKVTTLTVNGAQSLTIGTVAAAKLATIDASAQTGGLKASTAAVIDAGTIKLGSGVDVVTVAATSTQAGVEQVSGFEKAAAAAVGTDATAAAAAQADADILVFATATAAVANANAAVTSGTISKGVLTFTGAGPADLNAAFAIADAAADVAGEVVVFEYLGNSYVFQQTGTATDLIVKLVGVTGVTQLGETATDTNFFLV